MIDRLNKLLRVNLDASQGYAYAAEKIDNHNFRNFLLSYADRRNRYAEELKEAITDSGGETHENTTILGELHQAFMKLREAVSPVSDSALLDECVRGEGEAISQYKKVLETNDLKPQLKELIMTQFDKIRAARSTMQELQRVV